MHNVEYFAVLNLESFKYLKHILLKIGSAQYTEENSGNTQWCLTLCDPINCSLSVSSIHGLPCASDGKESACSAGDLGLIPRLRRSPGEGNGSPFQYSCLENPMDRGAWQATVHGVAGVGHGIQTKPPPQRRKMKFKPVK